MYLMKLNFLKTSFRKPPTDLSKGNPWKRSLPKETNHSLSKSLSSMLLQRTQQWPFLGAMEVYIATLEMFSLLFISLK